MTGTFERESGTKTRGRIGRGAAWGTLEVWGVELLQLVFFTLLARLLGPESYGLVALAMAFVMVPQNLIVHGGWSEALVQRPRLVREDVDSTFTALVLVGATSAVLLLCAPLAARLFALPELAGILAALAICPFLTSLGVVPIGLLQRELRFAPLALRSLLGASLGGVAALCSALAGFGPWSLVASEILWPLTGAVVLGLAAGHRPRPCFSRAHFASIARFARAVTGEQAIVLVENFLPRLVLGLLAGPTAVGIWALARKLVDLSVELVARPAMRVGLPALVANAAKRADFARGLALLLELPGAVAVPGYLLACLLGSELLVSVFGEPWRDAGLAFAVLALGGPAWVGAVLLGTGFQAAGRPELALRSALWGLIALAPLLSLALPWGAFGVAAAFALRAWFLFALRVAIARSALGIPPRVVLGPLAPLALAGGAMVAALLALEGLSVRPSVLSHLILDALSGGLVFLAAFALLAPARAYARPRSVRARAIAPPPSGLSEGVKSTEHPFGGPRRGGEPAQRRSASSTRCPGAAPNSRVLSRSAR
ncbi:MAG: oligosaccharide flippase family protein [Geminicoccaceae bacterium]|nr:oligosaccharide flippase family protein [Geminicoccaceae bacterium]MDW8339983.1 oligosaccharide flippase family protein [Geminicoccaceae bacterium]